MAADALSTASVAASVATAGVTANGADATSAATAAHAHLTGLALMMDRIDFAVMVPLVYASILVLVAGIVWRIITIARAPANPYPLRLYPAKKAPGLAALGDVFGMPQVRKHSPVFWVFLMIYHVGFVLLILGHLDVLPGINIVPAASRHMLGAGGVGVAVTIPVLYFIFRRFRTPVREISLPADYLLLLLLLFLFLFGDLMSWGNSWTASGFVMTKQDFSLYFQSLARFTFQNPRQMLPGSHYHFVVIHVLLAEALFALLPFTKIIHTFFSMPINMLRRR